MKTFCYRFGVIEGNNDFLQENDVVSLRKGFFIYLCIKLTFISVKFGRKYTC